MRITTLVVVGSLAASVSCSLNVSDEENVGTINQRVECHNPEGYYKAMASVAVSMGKELREWEATTHLRDGGWRNVRLTATAKTQCTANGYPECGNTKAILAMQQVDYAYDPNGVPTWNGTQFYQQLKVYLERLKIAESRPGTDGCNPGPHELDMQSVTWGICGLDYEFGVTMTGDPATLKCKLTYVGWPENPWLNFRSDEDSVTIDPSADLIQDAPSLDPDCTWVRYDPERTYVGAPCCLNLDSQGYYETSPWSDTTLVCNSFTIIV